MGPLISVIVPAYKVGPYIKKCLDSILGQTYKNIEVIIVLQPSNDGTEEICEEYHKNDSRIVLIHEEMCDVANARNVGVNNVRGKYLCFVDADDFVHVDYIKNMYDIVSETNCDIVQCRAYAFLDEKSVPKHAESSQIEICNGREMCNKLLFDKNNSDYNVMMMKLYKRDLFNGINFPKGREVAEDYAVIYKLCWSATQICIIQQKLYYYRSHRKGSQTHTFSLKRKMDSVISQWEMAKFFEGKDDADELYNQANYLLCNEMTKWRYFYKKTKQEDVVQYKNIKKEHRSVTSKLIKEKIRINKKILVLIGVYSPSFWFLIWGFRQNIRNYINWKDKK